MSIPKTHLICIGQVAVFHAGPVLCLEKLDIAVAYQYAPYIILLTILILLLVVALIAMMCTEPKNTPIVQRASVLGSVWPDEERGSGSQRISVGSSYKQHSVRSHGDNTTRSLQSQQASQGLNRPTPPAVGNEHQTPPLNRNIFQGCCPWRRVRSPKQSLRSLQSFQILGDDYEYIVEKLLIRRVPFSLAAISEDFEERFALYEEPFHSVPSGVSEHSKIMSAQFNAGEPVLSQKSSGKMAKMKSHVTLPPFAKVRGSAIRCARRSAPESETELKDVDMQTRTSQICTLKARNSDIHRDDERLVSRMNDQLVYSTSWFGRRSKTLTDVSPSKEKVPSVSASTPRPSESALNTPEVVCEHPSVLKENTPFKSDSVVILLPDKSDVTTRPSLKSVSFTKERDLLEEGQNDEQPSINAVDQPPLFVNINKNAPVTDKETHQFLNQFSSIFTDNLKDPIPKDPLTIPNRDKTLQQPTSQENEISPEDLIMPRKSEHIHKTALYDTVSQIGSTKFKPVPSVISRPSETETRSEMLNTPSNVFVVSTKSDTSRPDKITEKVQSMEVGCTQLNSSKSPPSREFRQEQLRSADSQKLRNTPNYSEVVHEEPVHKRSGILKTISKPKIKRIWDTAQASDVTVNVMRVESVTVPSTRQLSSSVIETSKSSDKTPDATVEPSSVYSGKYRSDPGERSIRKSESSQEIACELLLCKQDSVFLDVSQSEASAHDYVTKQISSKLKHPKSKEGASDGSCEEFTYIGESHSCVPFARSSPVSGKNSTVELIDEEPVQKKEAYGLGNLPSIPSADVGNGHMQHPEKELRKSIVTFQPPVDYTVSQYGSGKESTSNTPFKNSKEALPTQISSESPATHVSKPGADKGATLRWKIIIKHHRDNSDDQPPFKKSKDNFSQEPQTKSSPRGRSPGKGTSKSPTDTR